MPSSTSPAPIALIVVALAGCAAEGPSDRLRAAYAPDQRVTVGDLWGWIGVTMRPDAIYAADASHLIRIDRATGDVTTLLTEVIGGGAVLAADDDHVYTAVQRVGLVRVPTSGGAMEVIADEAVVGNLEALALRGGELYTIGWTDLELVTLATPRDGGPPRPLASPPLTAMSAFAAADDGLYVGNVRESGAGTLSRIPRDGGPRVTLHDDLQVLDIEVDGADVYWNESLSLMALPMPSQLYQLAPGSTAPASLATWGGPSSFAINDVGFYWIGHERDTIAAVPREAPGEPPFELFHVVSPLDVFADDRAVVYTSAPREGEIQLDLVPRTP